MRPDANDRAKISDWVTSKLHLTGRSPRGFSFAIPHRTRGVDTFEMESRGLYYAVPGWAIAAATAGVGLIILLTREKGEAIELPIVFFIMAAAVALFSLWRGGWTERLIVDHNTGELERVSGGWPTPVHAKVGAGSWAVMHCRVRSTSPGVGERRGLVVITQSHDLPPMLLVCAKRRETVDEYAARLPEMLRPVSDQPLCELLVRGM